MLGTPCVTWMGQELPRVQAAAQFEEMLGCPGSPALSQRVSLGLTGTLGSLYR